jgi:hypothetical protein
MNVINRHSVRVFLNQLWRVALLIAVGCCVMLAVLYALAMTGPHGHWFVGAVFAGYTVVSLTTLWKLVPWLTAGDPAQAQTPRQYLATIGFGASLMILWTLLERFLEMGPAMVVAVAITVGVWHVGAWVMRRSASSRSGI